MKRTARGFAIYTEFKDTYGNTVTVQKSSAACYDRVWVFAKNKDGVDAFEHMGELHGVSPHLSKQQARWLAKALLKFAESE